MLIGVILGVFVFAPMVESVFIQAFIVLILGFIGICLDNGGKGSEGNGGIS